MSISVEKPTNVRYGVLGFACALSMITYLDRVCISDPTPKLETSIAKNLVGHVYSLEEVHPQLAERTAELERELEKLVNNSECTNVR